MSLLDSKQWRAIFTLQRIMSDCNPKADIKINLFLSAKSIKAMFQKCYEKLQILSLDC